MKVIIQRSLNSSVTVEDKITGSIEKGFVILVGFTYGDDNLIIDNMVKKIVNLRICDDENKVMNKSILDTNGSILSISQFTLYADTKKGNRPSYIKALNGNDAKKLYDLWNEELKKEVSVKTGIFGADMQISLINDGPTTIWLER